MRKSSQLLPLLFSLLSTDSVFPMEKAYERFQQVRKSASKKIRATHPLYSNLQEHDEHGQTPLMKAAHVRFLKLTQKLLAQLALKGESCAHHKKCIYILNCAAALGYCDVIQFLLAAGVDIDASLDGYWPSLAYAARYGRIEAIKILLRAGADLALSNGTWAFAVAQNFHQQAAYECLFNCVTDLRGCISAFRDKDWKMVESIIENNPLLINARLDECMHGVRNTPLIEACKRGNFQLCAYLLAQGAFTHLRNSRDLDAAYYAQGIKPLEELIDLYESKKTLQGQILVKLWEMDNEQLKASLGSASRDHLQVLGAPKILLDRIKHQSLDRM